MMKALEFSTSVINNQIQIPSKFETIFKCNESKNIRVIVLIDEPVLNEYDSFKTMAQEQFFDGYSSEDSIYDKL